MFRRSSVACVALLIAAVAFAEPVILKNIPRANWQHGCFPVSILHTALTGMGCPMSYDELLVASGAAFRMTWRPGNFDWGILTFYQQDPIAVGGAAAGAVVERRQFDDVTSAFKATSESINHGRPVIAWDGGRAATQVICGYDEATQTLLRRTLYSGDELEQRPAESLKSASASYSEGPYELWLLTYDPARPGPGLDWALIIATALRLAQWDDAELLKGHSVCGESAYAAWATDLRSSTVYQKWPQAGRMAWSHASLLEESRRAAAKLLQANTGVHAAFGEAAMMYQDEAALFAEVQKALCGGKKLPVNEATKVTEQHIADATVREACADLIEQALVKDRAARAALAAALKDLAPELLPVQAG